MFKYVLLSLGLLLPLLLLPVMALAANELTFSENTTITIDDLNLNITIFAGSVADSMTVNSSNVQFTLSSGSSVGMTAQSASILNNSLGVSVSCEATPSLTLPAQGTETVVTVTPELCTASVPNTSGGGGGGGGTILPPIPTPTTTPATTATTTPATTPAPTTGYQNGDLIRSEGDDKVYVIENNKKKHVTSAAAFESAGYKWTDIKTVSSSITASYSNFWTGTLYKEANKPEVYLMVNDLKRHIPSAEVFNAYEFNWTDIATIPTGGLDAYKTADLYKAEGSSKVYKIANGKKTWIKTAEEFNAAGYDWNKIIEVGEKELAYYPETTTVQTTAPSAGTTILIKVSSLRVRSSSSLTGKILDKVSQGEVYNLLEEKDGWYKIKTKKGVTGWSFSGEKGDYAVKQ